MSFSKTIKIGFLGAAIFMATLAFNNCGEFSTINPSSDSLVVGAVINEDVRLMQLLNDATKRAGELEVLVEKLEVIEPTRSAADKQILIAYKDELKKAAAALLKARDRILELLQVQRLAISSNEVLREVDFLLVARLDEVDIRNQVLTWLGLARLEDRITKLEIDFNALKSDVDAFKSQVNVRFDSVETQIEVGLARLDTLNAMLENYRAESLAADAALQLALSDLKQYTEVQLLELSEQNKQLSQDILAQKETLEQLFAAGENVASLQGRLCSVGSDGQSNDSRPTCTGSEAGIYTGEATCCLTIDAVNCSTLFPTEVQVSARNQCQILVSTIRNHGEQLQAIAEVDALQTELIEGLLNDVENLNQQVAILAQGYELLANAVNAIAARLSDVDKRLLIVEFKAARAEAAAALLERADLNLAWIARRTGDVRQAFCKRGTWQSLNQFDYEAARQNWRYCEEKLEFLTRAKELTQLARAYTNGIQSINVDKNCSATISGKNAEQLSNAELLNEDIFKAVLSDCAHGPVLARAKMLNVVQLLGVVGPDFRTADYMQKKALIAQLLFFGKPVVDASHQERRDFELVDPTHPAIASTLYAKVERAFVKRYVENRMRTLAGTFPEDLANFSAVVPGFNRTYTHAEIAAGSTPFLQRLRGLELEGECSDCGFRVKTRTNRDVIVDKGGKDRYIYPKDAESLCPVMNDVIVLRHKDGKHYPYLLNYVGLREEFTPYLRDGRHIPLANSDAEVKSWNFSFCGRHADYLVHRNGLGVAQLKSRLILTLTQPYGKTYPGRGQCLHSALVCVMRDKEWEAPSGSTDLTRYLSGYANQTVINQCKYNVGSNSTVRIRQLTNGERNRIKTFSSVLDQSSLNLRAKVSSSTTQLTSAYWTIQDAVLNYGVDNNPVSDSQPFFGSGQGHVDPFIRAFHKLTENLEVQECTPNELQ